MFYNSFFFVALVLSSNELHFVGDEREMEWEQNEK